MRFHNVHGGNVLVDEGGKRATRVTSFSDAITFSSKPVAIGSRVSLVLASNDSWTGALRLGVTVHDPGLLTTSAALPKFSCPDLASKQGYWIRPLPERWVAQGSKLTFYVNAQGHFQLFVDNEYKGALLLGLPVKERMWIIVDLYGISVSAKFATPCKELMKKKTIIKNNYRASTPCAAIFSASCSLAHDPGSRDTRSHGPWTRSCEPDEDMSAIDAINSCRTSEKGDGAPWTAVCSDVPQRTHEDVDRNWMEPDVSHFSDAEYYYAVAVNVVREMTLQQRKRQHQEEKKKLLSQSRNSVKIQGGVLRNRNHPRQYSTEGGSHSNTARGASVSACLLFCWDSIPQDLPQEVVNLVEKMLKEAESKQDLDTKESEKAAANRVSSNSNRQVTFMLWDFDGSPKHFLTHQTFYSSQGIYLLLFDLTRDLNEPIHTPDQTRSVKETGRALSTMDHVHQWLTSVHVSAARIQQDNELEGKDCEDSDVSQLLPTVILVGTHRSKLKGSPQVRNNTISEKFRQLSESLRHKTYGRHVLSMYFAVDCVGTSSASPAPHDQGGEDVDVEDALEALRRKVEHVAARMDNVGNDVPLKWLAFERSIGKLLENGVYFASLYQLEEIARQEGIDAEESFHSVVHFLHQQGKLLCFGCQNRGTGTGGSFENRWDGTVVLRPQWFIDALYRLVGSGREKTVCWEDDPNGKKTTRSYLLSYRHLKTLWNEMADQIDTLVAILDCLDVLVAIYERMPPMSVADEDDVFCVVPWLTACQQVRSPALGNMPTSDALVFFIDFAGLLPVGFFSRLVVRLLRWCDWREATFASEFATIPLDRDHDLLLRLHQSSPSQNKARIQARVVIQKTNTIESWMSGIPQPSICEKVVHLIEAEMEQLRELWYCRLCFKYLVVCPCKAVSCLTHGSRDCQEQGCLHFLPLDECLHRKVVYCDYRRVQTDFVRRHFPYASFHGMRGYSAGLRRTSSAMTWDPDQQPLALGFAGMGWDERYGSYQWDEPSWLREAARLLESGNSGRDWLALAKRLGKRPLPAWPRFVEEPNPGIALLRDWRESNGATRYCVDVLVSCLQQMGRHNVAKLIQDELEPESLVPPVFISYQWDAQDVVLNIRQHLEFSGFPCWMDVGQVGGGDSLYGKIYEGISRAKV
ncbi:unnamed protein product, partial [Ixodes hexagonus]